MRTMMVSLAVLLVGASVASAQEKPSNKPNIVFILVDDVGYGDLGFTGHPYVRTPAIDKLAKQSAFFKNFYVSGPVSVVANSGHGPFPSSWQTISMMQVL